ncbi:MAG: sulfatase-like hydrolase/transferase [Planctomycetales bacterium]
MNMPRCGTCWLIWLAAVALPSVSRCAPAAEARPPNVIMIVADDQGWTDFGFMGHETIRTPHLDRLAEQSATFPNGYVPTSLCRASLATLLTGLYGHQHRICCNDPPEGIDRTAMHPLIQQAPALPRLLGQAGYRSFQTGKFWEGHFSNAGFTDGMTAKGRHGDEGLVIGRETMQPIYEFIEAQRQQPFFVWYAPMLPHEPHNPPERLLARYQAAGRPVKLAQYYAMCEWFDETCGELLKYLDDQRLSETTLVVFVVDNGWIQETGEVRTTRGWFAPKSKLSPYDGGLRTPILLRWPGKIRPARYDDLVSTIDLAPTILTAAGVPIPPQAPGISLLDRAQGGEPLARDAVFGEIFEHTAIDADTPALNLTHRWVRAGDWKLIHPEDQSHGGDELYQLVNDPLEERNLAGTEEARVRELSARLNRWWGGRDPATPFYSSELVFPHEHWHHHGSCVVECPGGDLLVCWYQGSGERRADDVVVQGARLRQGAAAWSPRFLMADAPGFPDTNPCMLVDPRGKLWLFWQTIIANEWHTALCRYKVASHFSNDGPPRWELSDDLILKPGPEFAEIVARQCEADLARLDSLPEEFRLRGKEYLEERRRHAAEKYFVRMGWMTRAHPHVHEGKRLIVPLYSDGFDFSIMALSDDWGQTWRASQPLVSLGGVQPSLARRSDGSLVALMRDNGPPPKRLLKSESRDGGETWGPVVDTEIPNPGAGSEVMHLRNGRWLLVNNDTEKGRHRLLLSLSDDEGQTWKWNRYLEQSEPGPDATHAGYPSIIQAQDGSLHATYTFTRNGDQTPRDPQGRPLRECIKHAHFNEEWIMQGR